MEEFLCKLCGAVSFRRLAKERRGHNEYNVFLCEACGVIQAVGDLDAVSPDYINLTNDSISENRVWCQSKHKERAFRQWWELVRSFGRQQKPRVLDVGCGTGGFLAFASERGADVYGFDASNAQAEYARANFENVRSATSYDEYCEKLSRQPLTFDHITLWDVLEHVREPFDLLRDLRGALEPNGLLFVSVPSGPAMLWKQRGYEILGKKFSYDPWEHVFYYSLPALVRYLNQLDYEVVSSGAVACYERPPTVAEIVRRITFSILRVFPHLCPQIYVLARKRA